MSNMKQLSQSAACAAKCLFAVMKYMKENDGTFSQQARAEAMTSKTYIKLIDGEEFIQMWQDNYSKMTDESKNMLPLKYIAFVGGNE